LDAQEDLFQTSSLGGLRVALPLVSEQLGTGVVNSKTHQTR
jgi:hypothetical protein